MVFNSALKGYDKPKMYFNSQQEQGKTRKKNSNNTESLTLQVDGPLTGKAIIRGWGGGGAGL